ncbi:hypothetical protein F4818DRAFT_445544 [Hypoxylon cercidicola]|nr:hypothetical protein F4818DRAFT_445544 [Hypoxylon cercidicola]
MDHGTEGFRSEEAQPSFTNRGHTRASVQQEWRVVEATKDQCCLSPIIITYIDDAESSGHLQAFYLVAFCCVGSFLFAYDTGIVSSILTFSSFQAYFRYGSAQRAAVGSNSTSLLQAGAFFSCFFIWPFTSKFGRRLPLVLASTIFCIGAIVQTISTHSLSAFYGVRVVSRIGVDTATVVIPM